MADNGLDKQIEILVALREATREATREAAKDLRAEVKAAREARQEFFAAPELEERLGKLTEEGLAEYADNIKQQIDVATETVYRRFDTIAAICMGEDPKSVREGKKTIPDLMREFIAAKHLPYQLIPAGASAAAADDRPEGP